MARNFAGGTDRINLGTYGSTPIGCIFLKLKTTQVTSNTAIASIWNGTSRQGFGLILNNASANKITAAGYDGTTQRVGLTSTTSVNGGSWVSVGFNWNTTSGAANALYINGTSEATGNSSAVWNVGGVTTALYLGDNNDAFWATPVADIAEVATWSRQLDAAEHLALASGFSPKLIAPANLTVYMPMVRDAHNKKDGTLTVTGTTVSDHPRTIGSLV